MTVFEVSAWYDGRAAAENNMQRVVPNYCKPELHSAWLAGYDNKDYGGKTPAQFERNRIRL